MKIGAVAVVAEPVDGELLAFAEIDLEQLPKTVVVVDDPEGVLDASSRYFVAEFAVGFAYCVAIADAPRQKAVIG